MRILTSSVSHKKTSRQIHAYKKTQLVILINDICSKHNASKSMNGMKLSCTSTFHQGMWANVCDHVSVNRLVTLLNRCNVSTKLLDLYQ